MEIKEFYTLEGNNITKQSNPTLSNKEDEALMVNVYPIEKEKIIGFGGSLTQSSAYNYSLLSKEDKEKFLSLLVTKEGLNYSMFRLTIGSSDFATKEYCYLDDDDNISNFNIDEDRKILIPFIKDVIRYSSNKELFFIASCWSPPKFMKTNNKRNNGGHLKEEYYDMYATYIISFIKEYKKEGINIKALTIQNEPRASQSWESCVFNVEEEVKLATLLRSKLDKEGMRDMMLLCYDHNKERLYSWADKVYSSSKDIFSGAAFHWYSGDHFGAIESLKRKYPNKLVIETEFCKSNFYDETDSSYTHEILNNILYGVNAIIEWNVLLDSNGGPYHDRDSQNQAGCDAPFRLDKNNKLTLSRIYYEMYMFSHFISKDAVSLQTSSFSKDVEICAVRNKDGSYVVNVLNNSPFTYLKICIDNLIGDIVVPSGALGCFVVK